MEEEIKMLAYFSSNEFLAGMLPVFINVVSCLLLFYTRRREREGKYDDPLRSLPDKNDRYPESPRLNMNDEIKHYGQSKGHYDESEPCVPRTNSTNNSV